MEYFQRRAPVATSVRIVSFDESFGGAWPPMPSSIWFADGPSRQGDDVLAVVRRRKWVLNVAFVRPEVGVESGHHRTVARVDLHQTVLRHTVVDLEEAADVEVPAGLEQCVDAATRCSL